MDALTSLLATEISFFGDISSSPDSYSSSSISMSGLSIARFIGGSPNLRSTGNLHDYRR